MNPGDRVFAMLDANASQVRLIGVGVYLGDKPFKEAADGVTAFGMTPAEVDAADPGRLNPCLQMDDGTIVWGCECWWGPESDLAEVTRNRKVTAVDMGAERRRAKEGA